MRGTISSRNNNNPMRTPYAQCGGPHYRSSCPQLMGAKYCLQCGGSRHVENECSMGRRAGLRPPNAGRGQPGRGGRAQVVGRVYAITGAEATSPGTHLAGTSLFYGNILSSVA
ncbi:hypothetical protein LR48_Vigan03g075800 [Vigna angularis]|uniref:CCHC-type domain-containing protein n=1 Tax=Phaseolus angularis TaxID=3914 RepID=A0A0L9U3L6_PHAAN|nr:hypothetical protein LR48_Vigan03g075800 [Vigna angularis]